MKLGDIMTSNNGKMADRYRGHVIDVLENLKGPTFPLPATAV